MTRIVSFIAIIPLLVGCIANGNAAARVNQQDLQGAPASSVYMVDAEGQVTATSLEGTWPVAATTDVEGLDTQGGQPLANIGVTLGDDKFLGIHSPRDVEGTDWKISITEQGIVKVEMGSIGLSVSEPIKAMGARIPAISANVTQSLVTQGEVSAANAAAFQATLTAALEAAIKFVPVP